MNKISVYIKKYKNMSSPAKAAIWYIVSNILQRGISFFVIPIYTHSISTAEYGQYVDFQSWREILVIFATLNLYCGVFTKAMVDHEKDRDRYTSSMQGLSTFITAILFIIYLLKIDIWNKILDMNTITVLLLFLYFLSYPALQFWSVRQRVEYRYKALVLVTLLVSVFTPTISICLLKLTNLKAQAIIWGSLLIQIIFGISIYIYHFIKCPIVFNKKYWTSALKFNIPLIPHYLSLIVLGQSDRLMIKRLDSPENEGIYGLAYSVSMLMNIIITAINGSLVPWIYERLKNKEYKKLSYSCNQICLLLSIMCVGVMLISPEAIKILGTDEYLPAIWVIPPLVLSVYITFCYSLYSNVEFYYSATKYVMVASSVGAITNIILNFIFIRIFGFIAAGYTTLACYFLFMIMHYFFMKRTIKKNTDVKNVFDDRFIWLSILVLALVTAVCLSIYSNMFIRYSIVVTIIILGIIFRKQINEIIKQLRMREKNG